MVRPGSCDRRMPGSGECRTEQRDVQTTSRPLPPWGLTLASIGFPSSALIDVVRQNWSRGQIEARLVRCRPRGGAAPAAEIRQTAAQLELLRPCTNGWPASTCRFMRTQARRCRRWPAVPARSNQGSDDARSQSRQIAKNLLRRTAGLYIWVSGPPWRSTAVTVRFWARILPMNSAHRPAEP